MLIDIESEKKAIFLSPGIDFPQPVGRMNTGRASCFDKRYQFVQNQMGLINLY